jgi:hypothetical protein
MRGFGKGVQIIEQENGEIDFTYVAHNRYVFSSPITVKYIFPSWTSAVNFLKVWDTFGSVQWWEDQGNELTPS